MRSPMHMRSMWVPGSFEAAATPAPREPGEAGVELYAGAVIGAKPITRLQPQLSKPSSCLLYFLLLRHRLRSTTLLTS
jgi:hypothetical protein